MLFRQLLWQLYGRRCFSSKCFYASNNISMFAFSHSFHENKFNHVFWNCIQNSFRAANGHVYRHDMTLSDVCTKMNTEWWVSNEKTIEIHWWSFGHMQDLGSSQISRRSSIERTIYGRMPGGHLMSTLCIWRTTSRLHTNFTKKWYTQYTRCPTKRSFLHLLQKHIPSVHKSGINPHPGQSPTREPKLCCRWLAPNRGGCRNCGESHPQGTFAKTSTNGFFFWKIVSPWTSISAGRRGFCFTTNKKDSRRPTQFKKVGYIIAKQQVCQKAKVKKCDDAVLKSKWFRWFYKAISRFIIHEPFTYCAII